MILENAPELPAENATPPVEVQSNTAPEQQTQNTGLGWRAQFPPEYHDLLKDFEKPGDFGKAFSEFKGKAGQALTVPAADDKEGWTKLYQQLGRPETPDAYQFTKDKALKYDEAQEKEFKTWAHDRGLTPKQADDLFQREVQSSLKRIEAKKALESKNMESLKATWGDKLPENLEKAKRAAEKIGDNQLFTELQAAGLSSSPRVLNLLVALHDLTSGKDDYVPGTTPASQSSDPYADRYPNTRRS